MTSASSTSYNTSIQNNDALSNEINRMSAPTMASTDGSSRRNGKGSAEAGYGIFFRRGDRRNVSEPLSGDQQTNQRAKLTAIKRALEVVPTDKAILIRSDSMYSIQCATDWSQKLGSQEMEEGREQAHNKDVIDEIIAQRERVSAQTKFFRVKGHSEDKGNKWADFRAVLGAKEARQPLWKAFLKRTRTGSWQILEGVVKQDVGSKKNAIECQFH